MNGALFLLLVAACCQAEDANTDAEKLTRAALRSRAYRAIGHERLLASALEQAPGHELARWHSGHLRHDGRWTTLDDLVKAHESDRQNAAYRGGNGYIGDGAGYLPAATRVFAQRAVFDQCAQHFFNVEGIALSMVADQAAQVGRQGFVQQRCN